METKIKIESIQKAIYNGKEVKLFNAYRLIDNAYHFIGQFSAPAKTANKNLINYVE